jgi:aspartyl-tRNA(Asn)/glutamyl-tRNA(Gln) amidotransferase subunit B
MIFETVIGVEVHAQLRTNSKMFCGCGTTFGLSANSQTCPVCLGLPGSLPVINRMAVEMAVRAGLALNCTIAANNQFARKNYFYPDLPKGYQISQYESPICEHGWIEVCDSSGGATRIRIRRAHLEEDAGKSIHETGSSGSRVDLNRAGTPLLEIVTEPDMHSAEEVVAYLKGLREILMYLDVCDGNMEEGSFRCEPNLSLRPSGQKEFGTKVELKNINSFKYVKDAVEYEIKRQTKVLTEGGKIRQETRLWNIERGETAVMRSKEEAHDYRYFPDPDLVPLKLDEEWVEGFRAGLPELPAARRARLVSEFGLSEYDASVITADRTLVDYLESAVVARVDISGLSSKDLGKDTCNFVMVEVLSLLKKGKPKIGGGSEPVAVTENPVAPIELADLLERKRRGEISISAAKIVLEEMFSTRLGWSLPPGQQSALQPLPSVYSYPSIHEIIQNKCLTQVSDEGALEQIITEVLAKNPAQVAQFKEGKQQVLGFLVGQVMKASGGKANPGKVNELLRKKLG